MVATKSILTSLYSKLTSDNTLMSKISGVYNYVPQNQPFPYIVMGDSDITETKFNTFGRRGKETRIFLHIYSISKGDREVLEITEVVDTLLDWQTLSINNNTHIVTSFENLNLFTERDDKQQIKARHAVVEYRVITQEN
jgi:hypothetical protein